MEDDDQMEGMEGEGINESSLPKKNNSFQARLAKKDQQHQEKMMDLQNSHQQQLLQHQEEARLAKEEAARAKSEKDSLLQQINGSPQKQYSEADIEKLAQQKANMMHMNHELSSKTDSLNKMIGDSKEKDPEFKDIMDKLAQKPFPPAHVDTIALGMHGVKETPAILKHIMQNPQDARDMVKFMSDIKAHLTSSGASTKNYEAPPNLSGDASSGDFDHMSYVKGRNF
jgi:preprotein translocase subunit SecD